jgi:hypothetical protein
MRIKTERPVRRIEQLGIGQHLNTRQVLFKSKTAG